MTVRTPVHLRLTRLLPALLLLALFVPLALVARRGPVRGELRLDQAVDRRAPASLERLSNAVDAPSWLGVVLGASAGLALVGRPDAAALLVLGDVSADVLSAGTKLLVNRLPPDHQASLSRLQLFRYQLFPSGHVTRATVTLALLVALLAWPRPRLRVPALALAGGFLALLGVTQVAVGGHLPLDVAGGYLLGGIWANVLLVALHALRARLGLGPGRFRLGALWPGGLRPAGRSGRSRAPAPPAPLPESGRRSP